MNSVALRGEANGWTRHVPAVPVPARDVCGAGDTVLVGLGLQLARQHCLRQAVETANIAAAFQVDHAWIDSRPHKLVETANIAAAFQVSHVGIVLVNREVRDGSACGSGLLL